MSKIVKETKTGNFTDSLKAAGTVRAALLRTSSKAPTGRDKRRDSGREEGLTIGKQDGYIVGLEEGKRKAYADAKQELDQANAAQIQRFAQSIETVLEDFKAQEQQFFKDAEEALAGLATEIAKRAIARELTQSRESVVALAHQVLEEASDASRARLRVSPLDGSTMEANRAGLKSAFSHLDDIEVVEDRSIGFGVKLETDLGMIEARVEDYLARIVEESREAA